MNLVQASRKIKEIKISLIKMQELTSDAKWKDDLRVDNKDDLVSGVIFEGDKDKVSGEILKLWDEIQKNVPPGFSIDGNLVRHISFNELSDWLDISVRDVPRELIKIDEYIKLLGLIEYIESLHPEVARISEIVLNGDIDAALKTVYSSLDSRIRAYLVPRQNESTVPVIGKAFKNGKFMVPKNENSENLRSFLQGVLGYYRSNIVHNPLPSHRNRVDASLSLFCIAHEAHKMLDLCIKR